MLPSNWNRLSLSSAHNISTTVNQTSSEDESNSEQQRTSNTEEQQNRIQLSHPIQEYTNDESNNNTAIPTIDGTISRG